MTFAQTIPDNSTTASLNCTILVKARQVFWEMNGNFTTQSQNCTSPILEKHLLLNQILYVTIEMNYPGFGGLVNHGGMGVYYVYVTDPVKAEKTGTKVITDILHQAGLSVNGVVFVKGKQSWDTWTKWMGIASQLTMNRCPLLVNEIGIDQENQLLNVGFESLDDEKIGTVDKFLESHQIPLDMVHLYATGPMIMEGPPPPPECVNSTIANGTLASPVLHGSYQSPLLQFKKGSAAMNVVCTNGLTLVIKREDSTPACVKPQTAQKLVERGWGSWAVQTAWFEFKQPDDCQSIPWIRELVKSNDTSTLNQSMGNTTLAMEFFNNHGVKLLQMKSFIQSVTNPYSICGIGTFFFLVPQNDTSKMIELGYQVPTDAQQYNIR